MSNIFIGFIFSFLDFNLNIGNMQINLIPDFIGFILISKGLKEISYESQAFTKAIPFASGMVVYTIIAYIMDFFGISRSLGTAALLIGIISLGVALYISYLIVEGILEIQRNRSMELNGETLKGSWKLMAIFQCATYIFILIPLFGAVLALLCLLIGVVVNIYFLVLFNSTKKLYELDRR